LNVPVTGIIAGGLCATGCPPGILDHRPEVYRSDHRDSSKLRGKITNQEHSLGQLVNMNLIIKKNEFDYHSPQAASDINESHYHLSLIAAGFEAAGLKPRAVF
jgi:hypothetical protein